MSSFFAALRSVTSSRFIHILLLAHYLLNFLGVSRSPLHDDGGWAEEDHENRKTYYQDVSNLLTS